MRGALFDQASWKLAALVRAVRAAAGQTDRRRWANPATYEQLPTSERNALIAALIPAGSSVLDLGAGAQPLKAYLHPTCDYQPCDLTASPGVLFCDFNAGVLPAVLKRYDYIVASGLLEYICKPVNFLGCMPDLGDRMLLSYEVRDPHVSYRSRLASGIMNHLTRSELESAFNALGFQWTLATEWHDLPGHRQFIYSLTYAVPSRPCPRNSLQGGKSGGSADALLPSGASGAEHRPLRLHRDRARHSRDDL